jgi:hypothetical protein
MMGTEDLGAILRALRQAWCRETAPQWSAANPACGQCDVTALVIHERFGGEILKTDVGGVPHFYNRIGGTRHDFTASQFTELPMYRDERSSHDEVLASNPRTRGQYELLLRRFDEAFARKEITS